MCKPLIAAVALALSFPAASLAVAAFKTPGDAAYCGTTEGEAPIALVCWTPNDGFTVAMTNRSAATKRYVAANRGFHGYAGRTLRFGQSWAILGYRCTSRSSGLTCTNRAGHGWWLGRYRGYRIF